MAHVDSDVCIRFLGGEEMHLQAGSVEQLRERLLLLRSGPVKVCLVRDGVLLQDQDMVPAGATIDCVFRPLIPRAPRHFHVPDRYEVEFGLGRGAYASVSQALDHATDTKVAIKRSKDLFDNLVDGKRILREVHLLQACEHDCVVRLLDAYFPPAREDMLRANCTLNEIYVVMELCDSDLKRLLRTDVRLNLDHIELMMYNLFRGLKYLHSAGVYHRDLKPANCLVNQDCALKIADLNLACAVDTVADDNAAGGLDQANLPMANEPMSRARFSRYMTRHVVSRWYRAPEIILLLQSYTGMIDVWSAGCILAELLQMLEAGPNISDRGALFPGQHCFPLSPSDHTSRTMRSMQGLQAASESREQLNVIFNMIGTPTGFFSDLLDSQAQRYLELFPAREGSGLRNRFAYVDEAAALDLLEGLVRFDPRDRTSVDGALEHPFLAPFRNQALETTAPARINLDFERDDLSESMLTDNFVEVVQRIQGVPTEGNVGGA